MNTRIAESCPKMRPMYIQTASLSPLPPTVAYISIYCFTILYRLPLKFLFYLNYFDSLESFVLIQNYLNATIKATEM